MERHISVSGFERSHTKELPNILISLAPEECSCRLLKTPNKLKSTENKNEGACETRSLVGTTDGCCSSNLSLMSALMSKHQQASQLIDKPVDEVANVQHQIEDNHQGMHLI
jgi:hypothetical protein